MRIAIATVPGAIVATVVVGCTGVQIRPVNVSYDGQGHGVSLVLVIPHQPHVASDTGHLTIRSGAGSESLRRRAVKLRHLDAFCVWTVAIGNGGMATASVELTTRQRATKAIVGVDNSGRVSAYTCGLHAHVSANNASPPWTGYIRSAIVAVRVTR